MLVILFVLNLFTVNAQSSDPNNYFKNRSWDLKWKEHSLEAKSVYEEDPVSQPNRLNIDLVCKNSVQKVSVLKDYKYCGLDSISIVGDNVTIYFTDYNPNDPRGYCTFKRIENFKIKAICNDKAKNNPSSGKTK